jgi:glycosyltransferase involved in cell wall biosynthesis
VRIASKRLNVTALIRHETGFASIDRVYQAFDQAVSRYLCRHGAGIGAVYAYEDGALNSFRAARVRGMLNIYDLPSPHWRTAHRILREEHELRPEWAATLPGLGDSASKLNQKDEELYLADQIFVASAYAKRSVTEYFGNGLAIHMAAYGAPSPMVRQPNSRDRDAPLRVLYAGHLRQSKGIAYLFNALRDADFPWQLILAGAKPDEVCPALERALDDPRCQWLGSIPHATLMEEMTRAHVFVFPSLLEGFGLVILEAMAAALPVITTPHTAGPECIDEGVDGYIVPIRDSDAIASRLADLYDHEDWRLAMASAALAKARKLSWSRYEEKIIALVTKTVA